MHSRYFPFFMKSHTSIHVAITGGIACGKSEIGRILTDAGCSVLDTDFLAHELMRANSPLFARLIQQFGIEIVGSDGEIDRGVLGKIVFDDSEALAQLNQCMHPAVMKAASEWLAVQTCDAIVLIPLLFEINWTQGWDAIVCVAADEPTIYRRMATRGLNRLEAKKRLDSQWPLAEKIKKSDFKIENNGSLDSLRTETLCLLQRIRNERN